MELIKPVFQRPFSSNPSSSATIITDMIARSDSPGAGSGAIKNVISFTLTPSFLRSAAGQIVDVTVSYSLAVDSTALSPTHRVRVDGAVADTQSLDKNHGYFGSVDTTVRSYSSTLQIPDYANPHTVNIDIKQNGGGGNTSFSFTNISISARYINYG